jgi:hypothetical protein
MLFEKGPGSLATLLWAHFPWLATEERFGWSSSQLWEAGEEAREGTAKEKRGWCCQINTDAQLNLNFR